MEMLRLGEILAQAWKRKRQQTGVSRMATPPMATPSVINPNSGQDLKNFSALRQNVPSAQKTQSVNAQPVRTWWSIWANRPEGSWAGFHSLRPFLTPQSQPAPSGANAPVPKYYHPVYEWAQGNLRRRQQFSALLNQQPQPFRYAWWRFGG